MREILWKLLFTDIVVFLIALLLVDEESYSVFQMIIGVVMLVALCLLPVIGITLIWV